MLRFALGHLKLSFHLLHLIGHVLDGVLHAFQVLAHGSHFIVHVLDLFGPRLSCLPLLVKLLGFALELLLVVIGHLHSLIANADDVREHAAMVKARRGGCVSTARGGAATVLLAMTMVAAAVPAARAPTVSSSSSAVVTSAAVVASHSEVRRPELESKAVPEPNGVQEERLW